MEKGGRVPLDRKLAELVGREWQTAAEIQRISGGETLKLRRHSTGCGRAGSSSGKRWT